MKHLEFVKDFIPSTSALRQRNDSRQISFRNDFDISVHNYLGARGGATNRQVAGSIPDGVIGIFQ
jgi:hypothetical protein